MRSLAANATAETATSVDGVDEIWRAVIDRIFADDGLPALKVEINDFGATPAVVRLRIAQAMEQTNPEASHA